MKAMVMKVVAEVTWGKEDMSQAEMMILNMGGHESYGHEGGGGGYMGKRGYVPGRDDDLKHGRLSVKSLYMMIRPRRQILGGGGDGGDSVIFVHPGGSQSPVGPNVRGESPLAGLEPGAGLRSGLGSPPVET